MRTDHQAWQQNASQKKIKNVLWAYQGCQSTRMDWECCANNQIEPIIKNASQFMY